MREGRKGSEGREGAQGEGASQGDQRVEVARMRAARQRQKIRSELHAQVASAVKALSDAAGLFEMRVRADGESAAREAKPGAAEKIKDKVLDKLFENFKKAVVEGFKGGEKVAEGGFTAFGAVKSFVDGRVKEKKAQTVGDVADAIHAGIVEKSIVLQESLDRMIDALPPQKLLAAGEAMDRAEAEGDAAAEEDGGDGPGRGDLGQGMRQDAMVNILGLPAGGLLAAQDLAVTAYSTFKVEVATTMSAAEGIDAVQRQLSHPNEDREKIQEIEEKRMGPKYHEKMDEEKTLKGRVAQVRS